MSAAVSSSFADLTSPSPTTSSAAASAATAEMIPSGGIIVDTETDMPAKINGATRCVLEDYTQCSKSHLWKLMMSFYDRKGVESWSQGIVPHFITSNAFIGRSYAKVLHGFIRDCLTKSPGGGKLPLDTSEKLYIIELGAGSGKFSYFMLKALEEMQAVCDFPLSNICYIMTDFTESNFSFWKNHPSLKTYFDRGLADAGIFDAVSDSEIKLHFSGQTLRAGCSKNPICIVANYLFDTLYHDIFQIDGGQLKEGLVSVGSKNASEPDPLNPDIIARLDNRYKYENITPSYYSAEDGDEIHLFRILNWYHSYFRSASSGASILMPIGALRALRRLGKFSNGNAIVISGDKGNNNVDQFAGVMDPHIAVHGSFSLMVNYHAIGAWFTSRGGFALHNPQEEASLKVSAFVLSADTEAVGGACGDWASSDAFSYRDEARAARYPHLLQAFSEAVDTFGPNDFFVLQKSIKEDLANPPLRTVVSLLKLGDWDPDVFFKFRDVILNQAPSCGHKLKNDLCRGVPRVRANYYIMDADKDISFEIGRFYYGIRDYTNALHYYKESEETVGEHHVTFHNQGLCHYSLGQLEVALGLFQRAFALNKDYEKARSWIEKVRRELAAAECIPEVEALAVSAAAAQLAALSM